MSAVELFALTGTKLCKVIVELRPGFIIVDYEGALVFASIVTVEVTPGHIQQRWELWAGSPSAEDKAALTAAIEASGGFDTTTTVVVPPSVVAPKMAALEAPNFADTIDEMAQRLRLAAPDPKLIELAAADLEAFARELRQPR